MRSKIDKQKSAFIRVLAKQGKSQREIAMQIGISRSAVFFHIHKQKTIV